MSDVANEERPMKWVRMMTRGCVVFCASVAVSCLGGCLMAGAVANKFVGPPKVPAQYTPAKEPMLVLVENYHNPSLVLLDAQQLSNRIAETLRHYDVAPVIDPGKLEAVRQQPGFASMTIPAVGRAVGAKQVLYVNVRRFDVQGTVGNDMLKGSADMTVRVVDAATGATRWPADETGGRAVPVETPWIRQGQGANEASLRDQMSDRAAESIVKMFRKYNPEDQPVDQRIE
jgi:hypothetical protein